MCKGDFGFGYWEYEFVDGMSGFVFGGFYDGIDCLNLRVVYLMLLLEFVVFCFEGGKFE